MNERNIEEQLKRWTLIGPFFAPKGENLWFDIDVKDLSGILNSMVMKNAKVKRVKIERGIIDFIKEISGLIDTTSCGIRNQAIAYCQLEVPSDITLILTYDADWRAVWWVDGKEVYATRNGNGGPVGRMNHRIFIGLKKGKHTLCVRVISSIKGWKLIFKSEIKRGIMDILKESRDASWRDYKKRMVRLEEERYEHQWKERSMGNEEFEMLMANMGVEARWVGICEDMEGSRYESKFLPMWKGAKKGFERELKEWVDILHRERISVISWYHLCLNRAAWEKYPDWRQKFIFEPDPNVTYAKASCCINSPYGDAVINYLIEAIDKFNLDGLWIDGSAFTPVWQKPQPVSCVCKYCREKFKRDTGKDLPEKYDWSTREFREWVKWRYENFSKYLQRLTDEIHKIFPEVTIVFNHYHRENIGWNGAVPLRVFGRNFVSGSEADGEPLKGAFHTRLMRAYGRPYTEIWMGLCEGRKAEINGEKILYNPKKMIDFVISCCTAGGNASFGGVDSYVEGLSIGKIAYELKLREKYINYPSIPYIALYISQQTETFVFGRNPDFVKDEWVDYYWNSVTGYHHLIAHSGLFCDVIFDDHLRKNYLKRYPILIAPFASALSQKQFNSLMEYVRNGGILITGPWFAVCNEEGEKEEGYPLGNREFFPFGDTFPCWETIKNRDFLRFKYRKYVVREKPLHSISEKNTVSLLFNVKNPFFKRSKFGKGYIIQSAFDYGTLFRYSESKAVVYSFKEFLSHRIFPKPVVEVNDEDLIIGVFRKDKDTLLVHIQQFYPPWKRENVNIFMPGMKWNVKVKWNRKDIKSIRTALPEPSPELLVRKRRNFEFTLPPFRWGQILIIKGSEFSL